MEQETLRIIVRRAARRWAHHRREHRQEGTAPETSPAAGEGQATASTPSGGTPAADMEDRLADFIDRRFELRYNVLTGTTECRDRGDSGAAFRPVLRRDLNALCADAHRAGIACWDRDVARLVESARIPSVHPFTAWFDSLPAWDGRDRLDDLARRVSDAPLWVTGFRRWMTAVAAQWMGCGGRYANSVAPLLVSDRQGMGKSTFCRALMPPDLAAYYCDSPDLTSQGGMERKLAVCGLVCLDEFDRIGERRHPQLKNLMQLTGLTLRRSYSRHDDRLPRIASFIGTSNSRELLSDPSGSRRFLCVEVTHPIDSTGIDHAQVYAQLKAAVLGGARTWFTAEEEAQLHVNNLPFYRSRPLADLLLLHLRPAREGRPVRLLSLSDIDRLLRSKDGHMLRGVAPYRLARTLVETGFTRRHTKDGNRYEVEEE